MQRVMTLRYADLTDAERNAICNGCGAKGGRFNPPELRFNASCNHHDWGYWKGGGRWRRLVCDWKFLLAMLRDSAWFLPWRWGSLAAHVAAALLYFIGVRLFGWRYFEYGPVKTRADLDRLIGR